MVGDFRSLFRFGTSSFSSKDWVGPFYPSGTPPADFLKIYSQHFGTVEIDATYYAVPSLRTVESWAEKTPEDFTFAAKFPASIVHAGEGPRPDTGIILQPDKTYPIRDRFLDAMSRLGTRLGPLILQFPYFNKADFASAEPFLDRLDRFLTDLPEDFQYGVEIRNRHWLTADFADLCRRHDAALVLIDYLSMPLPDKLKPHFDPVTSEFSYVRLIGNRKQIEAMTTRWDKEVIDRGENLKQWAAFLQRMVRRRVKTFVYVNNHYAGHAPATLRRLAGMVQDLFAENERASG